jgi:hypothetical protein
MVRIEPYFEFNPAHDEWLGNSIGIFTPGGFCLLGLHIQHIGAPSSGAESEWQVGLILLNVHLGIALVQTT